MAPSEKDAQLLTDFVRSQLSRAISFRLTRGENSLRVILLDPLLEDTIRRAITRTPSGAFLALAPAAGRDIHEAFARTLAAVPPETPRLFLTQPDVRRFLWQLIKVNLPDATVISYSDLLPNIQLLPITRVVAASAPRPA
jgi:type III secretion protein V